MKGPCKNHRIFEKNEKLKWPYLRLHSTYVLYFGTVKDNASAFYHTKNQVPGLCVGGHITILIFGSFEKYGSCCSDSRMESFRTGCRRSHWSQWYAPLLADAIPSIEGFWCGAPFQVQFGANRHQLLPSVLKFTLHIMCTNVAQQNCTAIIYSTVCATKIWLNRIVLWPCANLLWPLKVTATLLRATNAQYGSGHFSQNGGFHFKWPKIGWVTNRGGAP